MTLSDFQISFIWRKTSRLSENPKTKGKFLMTNEESHYKINETMDQLGEISMSYDLLLNDYLWTVMIGIYFFQEINGHYYLLYSGSTVRVLDMWKGKINEE